MIGYIVVALWLLVGFASMIGYNAINLHENRRRHLSEDCASLPNFLGIIGPIALIPFLIVLVDEGYHILNDWRNRPRGEERELQRRLKAAQRSNALVQLEARVLLEEGKLEKEREKLIRCIENM
jgi:hypothetical protein